MQLTLNISITSQLNIEWLRYIKGAVYMYVIFGKWVFRENYFYKIMPNLGVILSN